MVQLQEQDQDKNLASDSSETQLPLTHQETETETELSTGTVEDETEVGTTEPEVVTTTDGSTATVTQTRPVSNITEENLKGDVEVQTSSAEIVKQVDENSIEEVVPPPPSRQQLKGLLSLRQPEYPTVLRSPSIPELSLPVSFYNPYRLFNNNARPIPFFRQRNAGPINFF